MRVRSTDFFLAALMVAAPHVPIEFAIALSVVLYLAGYWAMRKEASE